MANENILLILSLRRLAGRGLSADRNAKPPRRFRHGTGLRGGRMKEPLCGPKGGVSRRPIAAPPITVARPRIRATAGPKRVTPRPSAMPAPAGRRLRSGSRAEGTGRRRHPVHRHGHGHGKGRRCRRRRSTLRPDRRTAAATSRPRPMTEARIAGSTKGKSAPATARPKPTAIIETKAAGTARARGRRSGLPRPTATMARM